MSNIKAESGVQFLARIKNPKSNLHNLEKALFVDGLKEDDIIELNSDRVYLKNVLLMHLIKNTILIDTFNALQLGGLNSSVLFINTAYHFKIMNFWRYLEKFVNTLSPVSFSEREKNDIINGSLGNLVCVPCYDSQQLLATMYNLRTTISMDMKIKFVILDDVGANYWQDTVNGGLRRMDLYEKKVISTLQSCIKDLKLPILYVRPEYFVSKHPSGCGISNYQIHVSDSEEAGVYKVQVNTKTKKFEKLFVISNIGLRWV